MTAPLIFLSHIHEEKELALMVKEAIEEEFSGFVDVFVSSDGTSIPVGSKFIKRIEDGLSDCVGAIYLISPISIKRNWINFELGAVWIRNVISLKAGSQEIPTLPICHSGVVLSGLPAPLNSLNGIIANQASQLESAFRSLQTAVGSKGRLKTDFLELATKITAFERKYTLGAGIVKMFSLLSGNKQVLVQRCQKLQQTDSNVKALTMGCGFLETSAIKELKALEANELKGYIQVDTKSPSLSFDPLGSVNGAEVNILVSITLVLEFRDLL